MTTPRSSGPATRRADPSTSAPEATTLSGARADEVAGAHRLLADAHDVNVRIRLAVRDHRAGRRLVPAEIERITEDLAVIRDDVERSTQACPCPYDLPTLIAARHSIGVSRRLVVRLIDDLEPGTAPRP